jgi:CBS domain-containing protein
MAAPPLPLAAGAPAAEVLEPLAGSRLLPVVDRGQLVGILTADNVFELLRFRGALETSGAAPISSSDLLGAPVPR